MAIVSVYIQQGATAGGNGSSGSPYNTIAAMLASVVADTALSSLNLVSTSDALIVYIRGTLEHATRHDITGITAANPIGTEPGDTGTCWFVGDDAYAEYDGKGGGNGFTNSSTSNETILCRNNIGFWKLNFDGAATSTTTRAGLRMLNTAQYIERRQCFSKSNRASVLIEAAANWQYRENEVIATDPYTAYGENAGSQTGTATFLHCVHRGRVASTRASTTLNFDSCLELYSDSPAHTVTNVMNAMRCRFLAAEGDVPLDTNTDNVFGSSFLAAFIYVDYTGNDFNIKSPETTYAQDLKYGAGTGVTGVLANDVNGTARPSGNTAYVGPFEFQSDPGVTLTGDGAEQDGTSSEGSITQEHEVTAPSADVSAATSSGGALSQVQDLTGENVEDVPSSTAAELTLEYGLSGDGSTSSTESTVGAIDGLTLNLTGEDATVDGTSTTGAVTQEQAVAGAGAAQAGTSTTGAVTQEQAPAGAPAASQTESVDGPITQTQVLTGDNASSATSTTDGSASAVVFTGEGAAQDGTSSEGAITISHPVTGDATASATASSDGGVSQEQGLAAAGSDSATASETGAVTQHQTLTGSGSAQGGVSGTGEVIIPATHETTGAGATAASTSSTGAITQAQTLTGANATQSGQSAVVTVLAYTPAIERAVLVRRELRMVIA